MNKLLTLLEKNARYTDQELAIMLGITPTEVANEIASLEQNGIIKGYKVIVDREKISDDYVEAIIELKVTPKRDFGFDQIAEKIAGFPEVEDLNLMSGTYDLSVMLTGKTFKDISLFVSHRLAVLDSVVSTATHFVLSRYKEKGVIMHGNDEDERGHVSL